MRRGPYREAVRGVEPVYLAYGFGKGGGMPDLSDCLVERDHDRPWLLTLWEPLLTKAPSPPKCAPWCCYIGTVIFYHSPYIVGPARGGRDMNGVFHRDWNKGFVEWDQIETRLRGDDVVRFDAQEWKIGAGKVVWARKRWWMVRQVRRMEQPVLRGVA